MSTIKPLSQLFYQLFYEAEIREGAQTSAMNRFFARFNSLPTAVRKEILGR